MVKYFENGNKELLKRVLRVLKNVYQCKDVEKMKDKELVFFYIAKTLESFENSCEIAESAETELNARISRIEKALKYASDFNEFKAFCLESSDE